MAQPYDRVFNFSAGPCTLPVPVLEQIQRDLLNFPGAGMSVMEMSHRSAAYENIIAAAEADLRVLLGVPTSSKVLFLQGGASTQFSMIPISFLPQGATADYVVTGAWGSKAVEAAKMVGNVNVVYDAKESNYNHCPEIESLSFTPEAAYIHFTSNETIQGVEFKSDPVLPAASVCDASSNILSRPMDVSKYQMIYAGAQKNMGPAGVAVVILSDEFLDRAPAKTHPMLDYRIHAKNGSMYNTPPCFSIYVCGLVYKYLLANGGLEGQHQRNLAKAQVIYDAIDGSGGFFKGHAHVSNRSLMNVTFTLPDEDLSKAFLAEAKNRHLDGLEGHRSVGGCRASIYNAFPIEGCHALAELMGEFARRG
jgi:phosphoserine aminotransferase